METHERLQDIMKARGMTQTELANAIGMKQPLLSVYMNGKRNIPDETLKKLANALDVDKDFLTGKQHYRKVIFKWSDKNPESKEMRRKVIGCFNFCHDFLDIDLTRVATSSSGLETITVDVDRIMDFLMHPDFKTNPQQVYHDFTTPIAFSTPEELLEALYKNSPEMLERAKKDLKRS